MVRTTTSPRTMMEMFIDGTVGESYEQNRLITEEDSGNVILTAYGWLRLAEYDETEGVVTVYYGHKSINSRTISRWINQLTKVASQRRRVKITPASPTERTPNEAVKFIGSYIDSFENMSSVEKKAFKEVSDSLKHLDSVL